MTIQPTAVYSPSSTSAPYQQTYNTRTIPPPGDGGGGISAPSVPRGGWLYNQFQRVPQGSVSVSVPAGLPRFLGARPILFYSWVIAMIMVILDEWHTYGILPRPARLWDTSIVFGLLAIASVADIVVPFVNIISIGFVIQLGYQYYTGSGQFGQFGAKESAAEAAKGSASTGQGGAG